MSLTFFPAADAATQARLACDAAIALAESIAWDRTPLGPVDEWPDALRVAARLVLTSRVPMTLMIGDQGIMLYNSAYIPIAGGRHPGVMGKSVLESWPEVTTFNATVLEEVMRQGRPLSFDASPFNFFRNGEAEEVFLNLDYTPVVDEAGRGLGVLAIVQEVTNHVVQEQVLEDIQERLDLALSASGMVGTWDWDVRSDLVTADERFARLFGISPGAAALGLPLARFLERVHDEDRGVVAVEIERAMSNAGPVHAEFRLATDDGGVRWVVASGRMIADAGGEPLRLPGVLVDITTERRIGEQLVESELRFRTLANTMPQMVWSALPDGFHDYFNARWYEFTGLPEYYGPARDDLVHPDDVPPFRKAWSHSLKTGEPYSVEYRLRYRDGGYRWILAQAQPILDESGKVVRWFGTCTDIHDANLAREEREVIAQELNHRIKNIFAVISGIVSLAARAHPEAKGFAEELRERIIALSRAHDFVRPQSRLSNTARSPHSLHGIIDELIKPYRLETEDRIIVAGEDARIDEAAATPLALIFHELATNAAKYGALAKSQGRVEIDIDVVDDTCRVVWRERGGPVTEPSDHEGFGSRLINLSVEGQLRGKLERRWEPEGLVAEIRLPLASLSRKASLAG